MLKDEVLANGQKAMVDKFNQDSLPMLPAVKISQEERAMHAEILRQLADDLENRPELINSLILSYRRLGYGQDGELQDEKPEDKEFNSIQLQQIVISTTPAMAASYLELYDDFDKALEDGLNVIGCEIFKAGLQTMSDEEKSSDDEINASFSFQSPI